jgi:hypothetical protein
MPVTEGNLPVGPTGKVLDTSVVTQTDQTPAHREAVAITDPETLAARAAVSNAAVAETAYGLAVRPSQDYMLEVSRGSITGMDHVNKYGENADISTSAEDMWSGGGDWTAPTAARVHNIVSGDVADKAPSGAGARTIQVYGLTDWDTAETSEVVTMDGTDAVATSGSYVIIHRMKVLTAGSSGPNVGAITATAVSDATVTARIEAGDGQTQMAIYGVPSVQNFYMTRWYVTVNREAGATPVGLEGRVLVNPEPGDNAATYLTKNVMTANSVGSSIANSVWSPPFVIPGPALIKVRAQATASCRGASGFDGLLVTE